MSRPRRFWSAVAVEPAEGGFGLRLDDRPLRTPAGAALTVPTRALAEAIAAEWRGVGAELSPEALPLTRAANVAIDWVAPAPGQVVDRLAAYGNSDLLCYRATGPAELRRRQEDGWDPPLAWAAQALGAPLLPVEGVTHRDQPAAGLAALHAAAAALDPFALTALSELVTLSGSLVLGLAVARGALSAENAWDLSRIDEAWQAEQWGTDDEAEAAAAARRADFLRAAELLTLLSDRAPAAPGG